MKRKNHFFVFLRLYYFSETYSMAFSNPLLLIGLSAILIPIIIHLFNFRRYKTIYFSNVQMLEEIIKDEEHYAFVSKRMKELNDYAMSRYEKIQQSIFVNGGYNYFETIKRFRMYYLLAKKDVDDKYRPLEEQSEWRGPVIFGISIFMLFYIVVASFLSFAIVRWVIPRRAREKLKEKRKRSILMLACGVGIFAISIMIASLFVKQNFILMAINLMITFAWLMEAILLSLLIRL